MEIEVLRAEAKHTDEIVRLLAIQLHEHNVDITPEKLRTAVTAAIENSELGFFIVAVKNTSCIGAAYLSFIWALEHGGRSGWLEELYVEPSSRASGIGSLILREVIAECRKTGCAAIDLEIDKSHDRVRSLYNRHGFHSLPRNRMVKPARQFE